MKKRMRRNNRRRLKGLGLAGILVLSSPLLQAQERSYATPDAVGFFKTGEGGGRGSEYMPGNVLGLPDTAAREGVATIDPKQILSLGLEGEIVLRFDGVQIIDGPGQDFTVFENAFAYRLGGKDKLYAEPGEVGVSRDGVEYVDFPYDPTTLQGCAGVTPTNGDQPPYDPSLSGGDGFDLAEIGVDSVRFIRIRDVTRIVKEDEDHPFYDVTLNGFDLDAVIALNTQAITSGVVPELESVRGVDLNVPSVILGSSVVSFQLSLPRPVSVRAALIDLQGREIRRIEADAAGGENHLEIEAVELTTGTYFLTIQAEGIGATTHTIRVIN